MPVASYFDYTYIFTQFLYKYMPMFKFCLFCQYNKPCILNCQGAFNYIHIFGSAYRVQSVFIWRCTSSNNARTIITAFLVSSRSPVLLADDTSGIISSIPATVTIAAYKSDFHALHTIKYINIHTNNKTG